MPEDQEISDEDYILVPAVTVKSTIEYLLQRPAGEVIGLITAFDGLQLHRPEKVAE